MEKSDFISYVELMNIYETKKQMNDIPRYDLEKF